MNKNSDSEYSLKVDAKVEFSNPLRRICESFEESAKAQDSIPIYAFQATVRPGCWLVVHSDDLGTIADNLDVVRQVAAEFLAANPA